LQVKGCGFKVALWRLPKIDPRLSLLEQIRASRSFAAEDAIQPDPFSVPGMKDAVPCVLRAALKKSSIAIFGDYDCDGICGTAILVETLRELGVDPLVRLPRRDEGYGIQPEQIKELAERGAEMIITVDNGITAHKAVAAARDLGVMMVVTDHHEPKNLLPGCPVVNPKLPGSDYRDYSGAGVAYLLACALNQASGRPEPENLLELVSLATVADICPVTGPNYCLARKGLLQMRDNPRPGIRSLAEAAGTNKLDGNSLGWQIGPRVNAAGRIGDPRAAYELITAKDAAAAAVIAGKLDKMNRERQKLVKTAVDECLKKYDGSCFPVFIIGHPHGIAGVVAGRVAQAVRRPVIVGASSGGIITASGRSIGEFDLLGALDECRRLTGLPEKYGGHRQAAGLSFDSRDLPKIQRALNEIAVSRLKPEDMVEWVELDGVINRALSLDEVKELDILEPCGLENPVPVFALTGPASIVREGDGWKLISVNNVNFFVSSEFPVAAGQTVYAAVTPYIDVYQNIERVAVKVVDVRTVSVTRDLLVKAYMAWRQGKAVEIYEEKIFSELGLSKTKQNSFVNLLESETFRKFGAFYNDGIVKKE